MSTVRKALLRAAGIAGLLGGATIAVAQGGAPAAPATFAAQVELGRAAYAQNCAACHGATLAGGQFATSLKGPAFLAKWGQGSGTVADHERGAAVGRGVVDTGEGAGEFGHAAIVIGRHRLPRAVGPHLL